MKPTIYDVAHAAGVSIATVSKVINNTGKISERTRSNVIQAMKKLNYYPSVVASALTGKQTNTIGLLIPDISNPFFSEMARQIEDRAHEEGLNIIMCSTDYNEEREAHYVQLLRRQHVDGFILSSGFKNEEVLNDLLQEEIPLVMLAQDNPSIHVNVVSVDDYKGGFLAASHLLDLGHTQIAIIAEKVPSSNLRVLGFRHAMEKAGLSFHDEQIIRTIASIRNGKQSIFKIMQWNEPPTAIFACNDLLAIGVIQGARELELTVPDDLSVMGFDDTLLATTMVPPLTTIAQPIAEMGEKVVNILTKEINGVKEAKERILFTPLLAARGTTKFI